MGEQVVGQVLFDQFICHVWSATIIPGNRLNCRILALIYHRPRVQLDIRSTLKWTHLELRQFNSSYFFLFIIYLEFKKKEMYVFIIFPFYDSLNKPSQEVRLWRQPLH